MIEVQRLRYPWMLTEVIKTSTNKLYKSSFSTSWMLRGPMGIGKAKLISLLTSKILKLKNDDIQNLSNTAHPDLFYLKKSEDEKKNISVEKVRDIIRFFSKTSYL